MVFLGDYLDAYPEEQISDEVAFSRLQDIVQLKQKYPDKTTLLLGNHDMHYLYPNMAGSRYDKFQADRNRAFFEEHADLFQLTYETCIGGKSFLFTHAGILSGWLKAHQYLFGDVEPHDLANFINTIWQTDSVRYILAEALSDVSYARWGICEYGSMVWADIREYDPSQEEVPGYYQVFGHSMVEEPVITPYYACLDCRAAFRIKDDGEFELL